MKFFVIPYLLAVDLLVPSGRFDYKPTFFFHVMINSSADFGAARTFRKDYAIEATMSCIPDPISLWCCFKDTRARWGSSLLDPTSSLRTSLPMDTPDTNDDDYDALTITNEKFLLEFDETGVKISGCKEKSERSRRMVQAIVDLLNVDVNFDSDERRGSSRLETVTLVDDCPVETRANLRRPVDNVDSYTTRNPRKLEDGFFKLMSHPDDFDETSVWSLDVIRTKNIAKCKNAKDFFFGSPGQTEGELYGYKFVSNVASSSVKMRITNENFTSTGYKEGTIASKYMKFIVKEDITVSIGIDDIYVPAL